MLRYNHLNLPVDVYFGNGQRQTIEYHGNGAKHSVCYSQTSASIVGGNVPADDRYSVTAMHTYVGPHVFEDGNLAYSAFDGGYFDPEGGTMYYLTDWQGNNVEVLNAKCKTQQTVDYYPYGEPTKEPSGQRFLYGGKEREHAGGRNIYDFSARCLISPLGQWGVPDQLGEKTPWQSIYSYCGGDPINNIDPDGRWTIYLSKETDLNKRAYRIPKDSRIHVVGHGNIEYILYDKNRNNKQYGVKTGKQLASLIQKKLLGYDDLSEHPHVEIILHSCYTGMNPDKGDAPLAQKMSKDIPNAIITAPNGKIEISPNGKEIVKDKDNNVVDKENAWRVFFRGQEVSKDQIERIKELLGEEYRKFRSLKEKEKQRDSKPNEYEVD